MQQNEFRFELVAEDQKSRLGKIFTPRGIIDTPAFMPVGTLGTVKGIFVEDLNKISDWIRSLIKKIDMKLLAGPYTTYVNEKGNKGMTSVAIIETSHIALHIWDEVSPGLMQFDVYSCANFNPQDVFDEVNKLFQTKKIEYKFLDREKELVEVNL